jgi:hypothetical protein
VFLGYSIDGYAGSITMSGHRKKRNNLLGGGGVVAPQAVSDRGEWQMMPIIAGEIVAYEGGSRNFAEQLY